MWCDVIHPVATSLIITLSDNLIENDIFHFFTLQFTSINSINWKCCHCFDWHILPWLTQSRLDIILSRTSGICNIRIPTQFILVSTLSKNLPTLLIQFSLKLSVIIVNMLSFCTRASILRSLPVLSFETSESDSHVINKQ